MRAWIALSCGVLLFSACAGPCAKVKAAQASFDEREGPSRGLDVALWLPFDRVDRLIAPRIASLGKVPIEVPAVMGLELPRLEAMVESVRLRPAAIGRVGFAIRVSLRSRGQRLLVVELTADVAPRLDRESDSIEIDLSKASVGEIHARLDKSGTKALSAWLWSQLPQALRSVTPRGVVDEAVRGLSGELVSQLGSHLKKDLPALFEEVAAIEIDLGGLPLDGLEVRSNARALQLALRSDLPVARGLDAPFAAPHERLADQIELRMAGESLVAFANYSMQQSLSSDGQISESPVAIPGRYNASGEPDPAGEFVARAQWARGPQPLRLEVFAQDKDCAHVTLAATPTLRLVEGGASGGGALAVETKDARLIKVHAGGPRVRSALFFGGVGRRSFELAHTMAQHADFEIGGQAWRVRVDRAALSVEGLTLGLALDAG